MKPIFHSDQAVVLRNAALFSLVMLTASFATESQANKLEFSIRTPKATVISCEPVSVDLKLVNRDSQPVRVQDGFSLEDGDLVISVAFEGGEFVRCSMPSFNALKKRAIDHTDLQAGGEMHAFEPILFDAKRQEFVFKNPGRYRLKATYYGVKIGKELESQVLDITVLPLPKSEEAASALWCVLDVGLFFHEPGYSQEKPIAQKNMERIIEKFPGSAYAFYSALALARSSYKSYNHGWGSGATDLESALKYLGKASHLTRDAGLREAVKLLRKEWAPESEKVERDPNEAFKKTVKELESQWYDVREFLGGTSKGREELRGIAEPLFEKGTDSDPAKRLPEEEMDRQYAELVKTFVKKYCKPLPPDEWKKRYAVYAEQDEGAMKEQVRKQKQQMEEYQKHAVDIEKRLKDGK